MTEEVNYDMDTVEGLQNCIKWQLNLVNMIGEGGTWIVPRSNAAYRIYKSQHKVYRKTPDEAVDRVFREIGWAIEGDY